MRFRGYMAAVLALGVAPQVAAAQEGDAAAGESVFRQCAACHVVENDAGEVLAGRNGKIGPNLYGVIGRKAGSVEGFRYGDSIVAAGEAGLNWDEATLAEYVQDPTGFLREYLDDSSARGKMAFQVRKEEDAHNIAAYLHSLAEGAADS